MKHCSFRAFLTLVMTLDSSTAKGLSSSDSASWLAMCEPAAMHWRGEGGDLI